MVAMDGEKTAVVFRVREFDMERDLAAVEELERRCQVGLCGDDDDTADDDNGKRKKKKKGMSLSVEQVGDPLARVRHAPEHVMLVAEYGEAAELVGLIKACVRLVSRGGGGGGGKQNQKPPPSSSPTKNQQQQQTSPPAYVKVACLLGLRVSPSHRRQGIATALVSRAEAWCVARGAAHATMATTTCNAASLSLFTGPRFGYAPFRRPVLLGRPVHAHRLPVPPTHRVFQLPPPLAAAAYSRLSSSSSSSEFLPADLPALLAHKLTLGTFVAIETTSPSPSPANHSPSFAVLSVWDSTRSMRMRVKGAPAVVRLAVAAVRAVDRGMPWMRVPSVRDIFSPFGAYLLYGLRMSGPAGPDLLRTLCDHAHNLGRENPACAVVAADLAPGDPAAAAVPRWRRFSCDEDVWCVKNLKRKKKKNGEEEEEEEEEEDWAATATDGTVMFVDPREF